MPAQVGLHAIIYPHEDTAADRGLLNDGHYGAVHWGFLLLRPSDAGSVQKTIRCSVHCTSSDEWTLRITTASAAGDQGPAPDELWRKHLGTVSDAAVPAVLQLLEDVPLPSSDD
ncbi:hypothetical protein KEM52_004340 [Ascosphaera acerosa]|nr:hypothetical protein KEM52_004340 [Ascosphaera acerosa]